MAAVRQSVDPLGYGEREEAFQPAPVPFSESSYYVPQGMVALFNAALNYRDNFHWGKHQYAVGRCTPSGGCNYSDARITLFTHDANDITLEWDTVGRTVSYAYDAADRPTKATCLDGTDDDKMDAVDLVFAERARRGSTTPQT